ncbi:hypothetical protein RclHR1_13280003 [Rhizophagus clarus]|uniref:Uncharacterized protein n=1 Tax=Rhizophagus clarus TaxID=94130 RepID=A0A2Z6QQ15_9GLOM|nr:hypothetical protein RclHR1_13280003 [Rhizophagus clarus]GES80844.1 hypothetical protein GLOIN_2v1687124 [Rhizophagus clarus]
MEFVKREDESRRFRNIRYTICGILTAAYISYLVYLIYGIVIDKPTLNIEQNFLDQIDVPDIKICGTAPDLLILRCDFIMKYGNNNQINNCSDYISPSVTNLGTYRNFCYTFKANKTIKYVHPDKPIDGLTKIGFYFYVNTTAAEVNALGIASLSIQLISPDFDPFMNPEKVVSEMDKATRSELGLQWNFIAGMSNYVALVKFKTSVYNAILPGDVSAIIGFGPRYYTTPKIESLVNYFPFNSNPYNVPPGTTGYFSVAAGSFIQESTTEHRSSTILGAIGSAGGALGVIGGITVILFGDTRVNPWGCAHKLLKEKTPSVFIVDVEDSEEAKSQIQKLSPDRSSLNQDARIKLIEHELTEIKSVIKHYLLED